jgi:hypothetical protein
VLTGNFTACGFNPSKHDWMKYRGSGGGNVGVRRHSLTALSKLPTYGLVS